MSGLEPGAVALARAVMEVEEEDERLGVVGRGRMVDRIYAALTPADRLAIAGITEDRLLHVIERLEVDGRPVWFVQVPDDARDNPVPEGDMADETPVAAAILAALKGDPA